MIVSLQFQRALCRVKAMRASRVLATTFQLAIILAVVLISAQPDAKAQTNGSATFPDPSTEFAIEIWSTDNGLP